MDRHLRSVNGDHRGQGGFRVVLADDHAGLRRVLRMLLDGEESVEVVGEADDTETALRQIRAHRPDVLVLDIRMPDGSMAERIAQLRAQAPGTQIVVITMHVNQALAEQVLRAGATGFVLKDSAEVELGDAVRCAGRGVRYTSPRLTQAAG